MATLRFHEFSGGLQSATTRFLRPANELTRAINVDFNKPGGIRKRLGYSKFSDTVNSGQNITGLHSYYRLNGDSYLLVSSQANLYRSTGGVWTAMAGLASGANYEFATFIDEVFVCGYNSSTRAFDTIKNLDATALTTTNNLTSAPNAKIPIVFRQRLYLISLADRRSAFQYSATPTSSGTVITWPTTNIEEVRTDDGDELIGAGEVANRLVLFKQNSMHEWNEASIIQVASVGTPSHRSIVNSGQYLFFFSRSQAIKGFYAYGGGQPKLISGKIQEWCDGIADSGLSSIAGWKQGNDIVWYVGTITIGAETFSNSCIVYHLISNTWRIYQLDDAVLCTAPFISSNTQRPYVGTSDGDVHQMAVPGDTTYGDNGAAIAALFRTTELDLGSQEEVKRLSRSMFFAEEAQGLQVAMRADGGNWKSLGQLTKTVNEFSFLGSKGYYMEFEGKESSVNAPFTFLGFSISAELDSTFK